jgi:four helix bundle protein
VEIALGSAFELETQIVVVQRRGWGNADQVKRIIADIQREQGMIQGFMEQLRD